VRSVISHDGDGDDSIGPGASGSDREPVQAAAREALPAELLGELMAKVRSEGVELLGDGGLLS
jgi:hypothetical protein